MVEIGCHGQREYLVLRPQRHPQRLGEVDYVANLDSFRLKSRSESTQTFSSLIGDAFHEYMVQQDLKKFSPVKCKVPTSHVVATILQQFKGQRYMGGNEEDFLQAFKDLGLR